MIKVNINIHIQRPAEEIFDYITNFENNPIWQSGMISCRFTSKERTGIGATYDQEAQFMGKRILTSFKVIEYEPARLVKASSTSGSFPITFTRMVEPQGTATKVSAVIEGNPTGFFKLARPLMQWMTKRSIQADYRKLKKVLENQPVIEPQHPAKELLS